MSSLIGRQMFAAEVLKLRRNRPVMGFALLLSVGVVALFFGWQAAQHASNAQQNAPAGGLEGFGRAVRLLGVFFGSLVAALVGTEAGTADVSSGVFRDLVATGRSRLSLFLVRAPAAWVVTLAFTYTALAVAVVLSFALAGGTATPTVGLVLQSAAWISLSNGVVVGLAVGVGALTGSRGATLTAVIGWQAVATQLLLHVDSLGSARDWLLTAALGQLMPVAGNIAGITMATAVAITVLAVWAIVPSAAGAWRTVHQDA